MLHAFPFDCQATDKRSREQPMAALCKRVDAEASRVISYKESGREREIVVTAQETNFLSYVRV